MTVSTIMPRSPTAFMLSVAVVIPCRNRQRMNSDFETHYDGNRLPPWMSGNLSP